MLSSSTTTRFLARFAKFSGMSHMGQLTVALGTECSSICHSQEIFYFRHLFSVRNGDISKDFVISLVQSALTVQTVAWPKKKVTEYWLWMGVYLINDNFIGNFLSLKKCLIIRLFLDKFGCIKKFIFKNFYDRFGTSKRIILFFVRNFISHILHFWPYGTLPSYALSKFSKKISKARIVLYFTERWSLSGFSWRFSFWPVFLR